MHAFETISEIRAFTHQMRKNDLQLGFVPTMGALHEGHISLVKIAQKASDGVSVSNFVNPTQFENLKDLQDYPNILSTDLEQLRRAGVMAVFLPAAAEIYAEDAETTVETTRGLPIDCLVPSGRGILGVSAQWSVSCLTSFNPISLFLAKKTTSNYM